VSGLKYQAIAAAFEVLSLPGLLAPVRRAGRTRGVIFTLHRVLAEPPPAFSPNAILQVTPDFLTYTIGRVRALGLDIVPMDEAVRRIEAPEPEAPFAVFSFDDAYRDNLVHALPILRQQGCPFTLYVPTALVDGVGEVWWQALEDIIATHSAVRVPQEDGLSVFDTGTLAQKHEAYDTLYWRMRRMPEPERVTLIGAIAAQHGLDLHKHCRDLIMDWRELKTFAEEPLCTIGAHTVNHYELAKLSPEQAENEIAQSVRILGVQLGKKPEHLSYPIGGKASAGPRDYEIAARLGWRSGVTTLPGGIEGHHARALHALPRISLNGNFQKRRYVDVFATGAVFSVLGRLTG